ncbi:MAG: HNH endonuclease signature motif containing protein [Nitrospirales bacterium]|nr:HNH endonuclease signature motif containing protein [Nitrospirales bacterium]
MKNKRSDIYPAPRSLEEYQRSALPPVNPPAESYAKTAREWKLWRRRERSRVAADFRVIIADVLRARDGDRCFWCQEDAGAGYQIDHHIPVFAGGRTVLENLRLLCWSCNRGKGSRLPEEFAMLLGHDLV